MRLLFVHQNFPGQYRHLAAHYAAAGGHEVVCVGEKQNVVRQRPPIPGAKILGYQMPEQPASSAFEGSVLRAIHRGRAVAAGAAKLRRAGFRPDVVFAHIGWGEAVFLKDVFPQARILLFCEFFYRARGADMGFDPEFPSTAEKLLRLRVMNAPLLMSLDASDWGVTPTQWQWRQFPAMHARRISVIHDGVDTDLVAPDATATFSVPGTTVTLSPADEVITYVARNLEPYRGFHIFMRALSDIQRRRPKARVVIVGGDEVSYSPRLPPGDSYRQRMMREIQGRVDLSRVHFCGRIPYADYLRLLRISSAHVYLTYPFVLSWSLIEALAAGCLVVASRTAPVEEVIADGVNGLLTPFFSPEELAARVDEALRRGQELQPLREAARRTARAGYDLRRVCLPAQVKLVEQLALTHLAHGVARQAVDKHDPPRMLEAREPALE
jgi:glycosyltransferase involved in cell wall biosynthesis